MIPPAVILIDIVKDVPIEWVRAIKIQALEGAYFPS